MNSHQSLLWKLSPPGEKPPSFLFGTMHIRDQRAFSDLERVYACMESCQLFALEIDLEEGLQNPSVSFFRLPGHSTLQDYLPQRKYQRLRIILLKAFGADLDRLSRLQPLAIIEILTSAIISEDYPLVLDAHLWEYASAQGKTTRGLETLEEQQKALEGITLEVQLKMLLEIGRNVRHFRHMLNRMASLYEAGDLKGLYRLSRKSAGGLRELLLFGRNRTMAARIATIAAEQSGFFAVGAAHLWGGKGMLRLLRQQGLRVEQVHL